MRWSASGLNERENLEREALRTRGALRELLEQAGLGRSATALAEAARWGWTLQVDGDPPADGDDDRRTRIGGRPLLPPGAPWPTTAAGDPLTFVAVIDLASAPPIPEPVVLPADGLLLVYVLVGDLNPEEGVLAFVEHEPNSETAVAFHIPPGTDPVAVSAPNGPPLRRQACDGEADTPVNEPVALRPVLIPLDSEGGATELGLHPSQADRYEEIAWALTRRIKNSDQANGVRVLGTLLGAEAGVQDQGAADGELVLLSINGDADVGLTWGDGGDVRILIDRADAEAGRWDRAHAIGDSY